MEEVDKSNFDSHLSNKEIDIKKFKYENNSSGPDEQCKLSSSSRPCFQKDNIDAHYDR